MITIQATIYYENPFWVGSFERTDQEGFAVAKQIFGKEPTDPEIYEFVLKHFDKLKFGEKEKFELQIKRINPKRMQRIIKKEMTKLKEEQRPSTFAQDVMRQDLEKRKMERKKTSKLEKDQAAQRKFDLKQAKRKEKKRGH